MQIRWKSHVSFPLSWGRWPHEKEQLEPNADAAHDENELPDKKKLRRELSPQSVLGKCDFPSHMKKLTLLGNVSPFHPLR